MPLISSQYTIAIRLCWLAVLASVLSNSLRADPPSMPKIVGDWWTIAGDPDLSEYTDPKQQPVDFAIWQAADGAWQLWSCIRNTRCGGKTRLFHRWESKSLTNSNWKPMGIALQARAEYGETPDGLQAPHVVKIDGLYHMFYGDWEHICAATSVDGKDFVRRVDGNNKTALFGEAPGSNTRDAMAIKIGDLWHCYYTAFPNKQGAVYCRTSKDTRKWSESKIVSFGGEAGTNPFSAECPFVVEFRRSEYYLFRTQKYGQDAITRIYHSHDPMEFGINRDDKFLVGSMPVAAPELILHEGQWYMASLLPSLKGIRVARIQWSRQ